MNRGICSMLYAVCLLLAGCISLRASAGPIAWKECLRQKSEWYRGPEALRIADNVLLYQHDNGGWKKNVDMAVPLSDPEKATLRTEKRDADTTIDNGATHTQLAFLARVYTATGEKRLIEPIEKGIQFLLAAQYPNGGWPQYYPPRKGYYTHITFNDDAMIGVMSVLDDIARQKPDYLFVPEALRTRAREAVERGVACIRKCQVRVDGKLTAWCAQHDETTLAPAPARKYEKISLSGSESVGIVRFLMAIEKPAPEIVAAIEGAVAWFKKVEIHGLRIDRIKGADGRNDTLAVKDDNAPRVWARFYEIGTDRPIFCGRDGVVKYSLAEIEQERRGGYAWYVNRAASLLSMDYPAWKRQHP